MRWPWTSVARLDDAKETIAALRADNAALRDALTRIKRREMGMPEKPHEKRRELTGMPRELYEFIKGWASPAVQRQLKAEAWRRYRAGEDWETIEADMTRPEPIANGGMNGQG